MGVPARFHRAAPLALCSLGLLAVLWSVVFRAASGDSQAAHPGLRQAAGQAGGQETLSAADASAPAESPAAEPRETRDEGRGLSKRTGGAVCLAAYQPAAPAGPLRSPTWNWAATFSPSAEPHLVLCRLQI